MANVLTDNSKKHVAREYQLRLATVALVLLFVLMAVASLLLAPSVVLLYTQQNNLQAQVSSVRNNQDQSKTESQRTIERTNALLGTTLADGTERYSTVVKRLVENKPSNVSLRSITLERQEAATAVNVSGISATRDSLLAYERSLQSNALFSSVELPVSNLAQRQNVEFSLRFQAQLSQGNESSN